MVRHQVNQFSEYLEESLKYGFINQSIYSHSSYAPQALLNDSQSGRHVLTDIQNEINKSLSFCIHVAFVTEAGIGMIKSQLSDFSDRGGTGKLLISPYLGFNHPNALKELLKLKNIEVRMAQEKVNSHAKMYLFNHGIEQVAIIGSSNLTHQALKLNYEWNVKLSSTQDGEFIYKSQKEFDRIWIRSAILTPELIEQYKRNIFSRQILKMETIQEPITEIPHRIQPNHMQSSALMGIQAIRQNKGRKGLVISATGTGKTYLSAFDVQSFQPNKFLFVVHREQILRKACQDFQKVIGFQSKEACIYKSGMDISDKRYIFSTIDTISMEKNFLTFASDYFDYILIDEAHRVGAMSYLKILDYFQPEFLLGMTATPERTDGKNIYELFDYNIAYEIRLQTALDEDMLCPFLYYGVTDYIKNGEYITEDIEFNQLVSHERIQHLVKKIEYYGYSGEKVKGLMFCSSKQEAHELSDQLNQLGYRTKALTGEDSQPIREQTVKNLEEGKLDYILTVDIFNEGIDIPSINQVVMLRNTQSSIIFIQQLGRGLRKHASKEFVTIIDFIGNYQNNYMIPIALFGDQSMNKDNYRREMVNRNQLEGITTINFEKIAQKQIFDSINQTSLSSLKILREKFFELENRLGRIPLLKDFLLTNSVNPVTFFEGNILHYGQFLQKVKKENSYSNNSEADGLLTFISKELLEGKRKHELIFLKMLMEIKNFSLSEFRNQLIDLDLPSDETTIKSVMNVLTLKFFREQMQKKYGGEIVEINGDQISYTPTILQALKDPITRALVLDGIETGLLLSNEYDAKLPLTIGKKYSRKDFCRLLNWKQDDSATIYGYKTKNHTTPIFVTYHKSEDISQSTQYGDRFINEEIFHWYTRSNRTLQSNEVKEIIDHHEIGNELHLFIKKEDGEGTDFYYLGQVDYVPNSALDTKMPQTDQPVVTMNLQLRQPISYELLHYFTEQ